ncbi:MAG: hypothetical protein WC976_06775 [Caldisericia bacterium]
MVKEKTYHFKVTLVGTGKNSEEAWKDATDGFALDPGPTPEKSEYEIIPERGK